jgi:hypothetical protein
MIIIRRNDMRPVASFINRACILIQLYCANNTCGLIKSIKYNFMKMVLPVYRERPGIFKSDVDIS